MNTNTCDAPVRVMIVDDHRLARETVRQTLEPETRIEIVGEAQSGAEALALVDSAAPDVIVLDYCLGDWEAPEVIDRLRDAGCAAEIVILTTYAFQDYARTAMAHGARAFLGKDAGDLTALASAIANAHAGLTTLRTSPHPGPPLPGRAHDDRTDPKLSQDDRSVWRLMALGKADREIAAELGLSEDAVERHVEALRDATGARSRAELVAEAYRSGLAGT